MQKTETLTKPCLYCKTPILLRTTRDKERRKFCNLSCRAKWHNAKSGFGLPQTGPTNPRWKGGKCLDSSGYILTYHPNGHRLEHRVVMEEILGRSLASYESVHHKNGIRTDNRPENLELWMTRWHPQGVRVNDLETPFDIYRKNYNANV